MTVPVASIPGYSDIWPDAEPSRADREPAAPSLRANLTVLALLTLLPVTLAAGLLLWVDYQRNVANAQAQALVNVRTVAAALDSRLSEILGSVQVLARSPSLVEGRLAQFYGVAVELQKSDHFGAHLVVVDEQGAQLLNTAVPFGAPLPRSDPPPQIQNVFGTGRGGITDLLIGRVTKRPAIAVAEPVMADGKVELVLAASVDSFELHKTLKDSGLPATWTVAIIDNAGRIIARGTPGPQYIGDHATTDLLVAIDKGREGTFRGTNKEGVPVVGVFSRMPRNGWTVAIGIPRTEFTDPVSRSFLYLAIGLGIAALVSVLAAAAYSARIVGSIKRLTVATRELEADSRPSIGPLAFEEANELARALQASAHAAQIARRALEGQQAKLEAIFENARDGIFLLDIDGKVLSVNFAGARMLQRTKETIVGASFDELLRPGPQDLVGVLDEDVMTGLRADGSQLFALLSKSSFMVGHHTVTSAIVRDVTQRLRVELELLRSNENLQQFAYVASHDLRAPLLTMQGFLQLLDEKLHGRLDPTERNMLGRVRKAAGRLDQLTDDLLAYARLDRATNKLEPCDLGEVVSLVREDLATQLRDTQASIEVLTPLPRIQGDAGQLAQLFQNLFVNALKYRSHMPPRVSVSAVGVRDGWQISVADNGPGIDPAFHDRIFELFERLQSSGNGTGIGLAVCKRVVERHGGRIWVESAEGQGATFHFTLKGGGVDC